MQIIDLSLPIYNKMPVYPGDPEVKIEQIHSLKKEGWRLRLLSLGSHTGTHVDAFAHMDDEGKTIDEIPIQRFFGEAKVVSIDSRLPKKIGLVFSKQKLCESVFEKIKNAHPPFIAVGRDCEFEVELERKLLKNGIVTFTDLINIDLLPKNKQFMFYGFPLKITGGDGSPERAVAVI